MEKTELIVIILIFGIGLVFLTQNNKVGYAIFKNADEAAYEDTATESSSWISPPINTINQLLGTPPTQGFRERTNDQCNVLQSWGGVFGSYSQEVIFSAARNNFLMIRRPVHWSGNTVFPVEYRDAGPDGIFGSSGDDRVFYKSTRLVYGGSVNIAADPLDPTVSEVTSFATSSNPPYQYTLKVVTGGQNRIIESDNSDDNTFLFDLGYAVARVTFFSDVVARGPDGGPVVVFMKEDTPPIVRWILAGQNRIFEPTDPVYTLTNLRTEFPIYPQINEDCVIFIINGISGGIDAYDQGTNCRPDPSDPPPVNIIPFPPGRVAQTLYQPIIVYGRWVAIITSNPSDPNLRPTRVAVFTTVANNGRVDPLNVNSWVAYDAEADGFSRIEGFSIIEVSGQPVLSVLLARREPSPPRPQQVYLKMMTLGPNPVTIGPLLIDSDYYLRTNYAFGSAYGNGKAAVAYSIYGYDYPNFGQSRSFTFC